MTKVFNDKNDWIELRSALLESVSWKEAVARKYRIEPYRVDKAIEAWITHFATQGEEYVALNRAKAWCSNWIGKQLEQNGKSTNKPKRTSELTDQELLKAVAKRHGYVEPSAENGTGGIDF